MACVPTSSLNFKPSSHAALTPGSQTTAHRASGFVQRFDGANPRPFGTSGMSPADSASRAGDTPEASGDSSSGTLAQQILSLVRYQYEKNTYSRLFVGFILVS